MRPLSFLALFLMLMALLSFNSEASGKTAQSFLSVRGTEIVDANGQAILLRGVNYPGYAWENPNGYPVSHRAADYATLAKLGFNVVRLPISWANFEPRPGVFDLHYLYRYLDRDVSWAKQNGLYVVLDMHQFRWSSRFNGSGIPDWAVRAYPPTSEGKHQAISNFWINSSLQEHLAKVWNRIAKHYSNEPAIAGYDILNEPFVCTSVLPYLNATHVDEFNSRIISSIRTVDPKHIIFIEPTNFGRSKVFRKWSNLVWSPHFYAMSFYPTYFPENVTVLEADLAAKYRQYVLEDGVPMWIGEFGAFMKDGSDEQWLRDAVGAFNSYQIGWAWWSFSGRGRGIIPSALHTPPSDPTSATTTQSISAQTTTTTFTPIQPVTSDSSPEKGAGSMFLAAFGFVIALAASLRHQRK